MKNKYFLAAAFGAFLSLVIPVRAASESSQVIVTKKQQTVTLDEFFKDAVYATVTSVQPNFKEITTTRPRQVCREENVPVYGKVQGQGASGLDVLAGAVIGGLFGKALTDKDEGAAAGAVVGGVVAAEAGRADRTEIVGYTQKEVCSTQYVDRVENVLDNYTIYYEWQGQYGSTVVDKRYRIGDQVAVMVIITMLSGQ
jgi:uncharacterized protein YcfJ